MRFTNFSDGTGESAVKKVDAASTTIGYNGVANGTYIRIKAVKWVVRNGGLRILWDATSDEDAFVLNGEGHEKFPVSVPVPAIAGADGSLLFTTSGFMLNSGYDVTLHMIKGIPR